jgi:cellulose synthase/poly-beta-1,6-N-acetylglucosamine synthase-like glycosyltransferase
MTMPILLFYIAAATYGTGMLILALALWRRRVRPGGAFQPTVSIIIAARNEEHTIGSCLASMTALTYPRELLEIIVVDDHSTDRTADVVRAAAEGHTGLKLVHAGSPEGNLRGKVNALVHGIAVSRGEILLFTDADCAVPPEWVDSIVRHYDDTGVGIVAGMLRLPSRTLFEGIQAIDWYLLLSAASATARLGFPVTAVGNNYSIRRSAYDRVGGYASIPFCVTEDLSLFQATTAVGYRAVVTTDPQATVATMPCTTWRQLFAQRRRWFVGGRQAPWSRIAAFALAYTGNVLALFGWLSGILPSWALLVGIKAAADLLLVLPVLQSEKRIGLIRNWLLFEMYFTLYVVLLPVMTVLAPRVTWKGRAFR